MSKKPRRHELLAVVKSLGLALPEAQLAEVLEQAQASPDPERYVRDYAAKVRTSLPGGAHPGPDDHVRPAIDESSSPPPSAAAPVIVDSPLSAAGNPISPPITALDPGLSVHLAGTLDAWLAEVLAGTSERDDGYKSARVDLKLYDKPHLREFLARLRRGLNSKHARLPSGRHVESIGDAALYVFERLAAAAESALPPR